ncbi:MAG: hypothetical protein LBM66_03090, partial [Bifidobacteriaceae bacterium]|nr:hypothetical protein [Bifidobacteriaceae bacterium]
MGLARRLAAGAAGVLVAVALAAGAAGAAWAGTRAASGAPTADAGSRVVSAAPAAREAADDAASPAGQRRTVLIGTGGIGWDDVSETATPALWRAAGQASTSLGAVITRSVRAGACPVDGWLAVSSGGRAADAATKGAADLDVPTDCATLAAPVDGTVPGWQAYRKLASASGYDPPLGQLGDLIAAYDTAHAAGTGAPFAVGIGPGAAIALADSAGHVQGAWEAAASTAAGLAAQVTRALEGSAVIVVVDAGGLRGGAAGGARLTALDQRLGAALAAAGKAAAAPRVTLASLWDRSRPALGLALDADPATPSTGLLGSTATDRPAVTVTTDFH